MARKSGFVRRGGVMRRETLWFTDTPTRTTMAAASTAVLVGSLNASALALRPFTVIRTVGYMHVKSDQTAVLEDYNASLGCAIVSDQATAIGVTAVPTPMTDNGSDLWYFYQHAIGSFIFIDGTSFDPVGGVGMKVESKGARKVQEGEDLVIVAETGSNSSGVVLAKLLRILVKLH